MVSVEVEVAIYSSVALILFIWVFFSSLASFSPAVTVPPLNPDVGRLGVFSLQQSLV